MHFINLASPHCVTWRLECYNPDLKSKRKQQLIDFPVSQGIQHSTRSYSSGVLQVVQ